MQSLHLELTTRCVLECPGCPRTWFSKTFGRKFPNQDLDHDLLHKFLDCDRGRKISHFELQSNHGDIIYYPKIINFLDQWRDSKNFVIFTNGSRRSSEFWHEINSRLTAKDQIVFSIDGLEHTNHLYRKNSDWDSLIEAVKICTKGPARIVWKTIIFSFNQHDLDTMETFALDQGVDEFRLIKTHRFGDDTLKPTVDRIDTVKLYENSMRLSKISPQCGRNSNQTFVTPDGYCWPCCWMTSYYTLHKTDLWQNRGLYDIRTRTFDQILDQIDLYATKVKTDPQSAHSVCHMMCGRS